MILYPASLLSCLSSGSLFLPLRLLFALPQLSPPGVGKWGTSSYERLQFPTRSPQVSKSPSPQVHKSPNPGGWGDSWVGGGTPPEPRQLFSTCEVPKFPSIQAHESLSFQASQPLPLEVPKLASSRVSKPTKSQIPKSLRVDIPGAQTTIPHLKSPSSQVPKPPSSQVPKSGWVGGQLGGWGVFLEPRQL